MSRTRFETMAYLLASGLSLAGCGQSKGDPKAEAPPAAKVEHEQDVNSVKVDHPEQFPLFTAIEHAAASKLVVTGVVSPDVSRTVPVISIATGRVVEIKARLGDVVKKGQVLLRVQSADMSGAFSDYRKAVADEKLARIQFERAKLLYDKGAISLNDFQTAEDVENKAQVDVENTTERLRVLGGSTDQRAAIVDIRAPVSGVITDQQVTNALLTTCCPGCNPETISCILSGSVSPDLTSTRRKVLSPVGTYTHSRSCRCKIASAGTAACIAFFSPWNVAVTNIPIFINPGFAISIRTFAVRRLGSRIGPMLPIRPRNTLSG